MRYSVVLFIVQVLIPFNALLSAEEAAFDLEAVISYALEHNPGLSALESEVDESIALARQAGLYYNPSIEIESEEMPDDAFGRFGQSSNTFSVSQTIDVWGKLRSARTAGNAHAAVLSHEFLSAKLEIEAELQHAFNLVLLGKRKHERMSRLADMAKELSELVSKRVQAGAAAPMEQLRAELEYRRVKVERENSEVEVNEAEQELVRLLAWRKDTPPLLEGPVTVTSDLPPLALLKDTLDRHPAMRGASLEIDASRAEQKAVNKEWLPDPTMRFGLERNEIEKENTFVMGIEFDLSLFDRGQGTRQAAVQRLGTATARREATRMNLSAELTTLHAASCRLLDNIRQYEKEILPTARKAIEMADEGFRQGKFSYLEVLDMHRELVTAEIEYLDILTELSEKRAPLDRIARTLQLNSNAPNGG